MYPFERFTERAKKTLTLAQEEAERSHHSYIGTEHLLLGLLRVTEGEAYQVLRELGIEIDMVRQTIAAVLGRNERIIIQQIVPTSRVKTVIEIAFEEARRLGHEYVDTGHLLMALVIEGEGIAAHVLEDLGATAEKVIAALERRWGVGASGRGKQPQPKGFPIPRMVRLPGSTRTVARLRQPLPAESDSQALLRLLLNPDVAALLQRHGADVDRLKSRLMRPPDNVMKLRHELEALKSALDDAASSSDYARAAKVQNLIEPAAKKLREAEATWLGSLSSE